MTRMYVLIARTTGLMRAMCILERCGHEQPGGAKMAILSEALDLRNVIRSNRTSYVRTRVTNPARTFFLPSFLAVLLPGSVPYMMHAPFDYERSTKTRG
jgi:hypothetical protein